MDISNWNNKFDSLKFKLSKLSTAPLRHPVSTTIYINPSHPRQTETTVQQYNYSTLPLYSFIGSQGSEGSPLIWIDLIHLIDWCEQQFTLLSPQSWRPYSSYHHATAGFWRDGHRGAVSRHGRRTHHSRCSRKQQQHPDNIIIIIIHNNDNACSHHHPLRESNNSPFHLPEVLVIISCCWPECWQLLPKTRILIIIMRSLLRTGRDYSSW